MGDSKISRNELNAFAEAMAKALIDMAGAIAKEIEALKKRLDELEKGIK